MLGKREPFSLIPCCLLTSNSVNYFYKAEYSSIQSFFFLLGHLPLNSIVSSSNGKDERPALIKLNRQQ